jgi:hypothetical protein
MPSKCWFILLILSTIPMFVTTSAFRKHYLNNTVTYLHTCVTRNFRFVMNISALKSTMSCKCWFILLKWLVITLAKILMFVTTSAFRKHHLNNTVTYLHTCDTRNFRFLKNISALKSTMSCKCWFILLKWLVIILIITPMFVTTSAFRKHYVNNTITYLDTCDTQNIRF